MTEPQSPPPAPRRTGLLLGVAIAAVLAVGGGTAAYFAMPQVGPTQLVEAPAQDCDRRAVSSIGGPISLIDETGRRVTEADFKGTNTIVYFGFTNCPDVCPMSLTTVAAALDKLPEAERADFRTVLVSVDPERDTPEVMERYTASGGFPPDLLGLTGSLEDVRAAARSFRVAFSRVDQPNSALGYVMDHTSITYVMGPDWTLRTFFAGSEPPDVMAKCLADIAAAT
jgi:protein SCO1/2